VEVEPVAWGDPRAVAQRDAMNAETGAMYEKFVAGLSAESQAALDDALAVDPAEMRDTILVVDGDAVLGHAALRQALGFGPEVLEVKKVFVGSGHRGRGVARRLMAELEKLARDRGATSLVLQTGDLQQPAIALYLDLGYVPIPPYGKYVVMPNALCYQKAL
jgi:GNAT superfamily N-acetyltransferase